MAGVLPVELLYLFDSEEVETLICGSSDVSVSFLKSVTEYDGVSPTDPHILMFWCVPPPTVLCAMGCSVRAWSRLSLPIVVLWVCRLHGTREVLSELPPADRTAFLKFVWARSRLPSSANYLPMPFKLQVP